ncbi:fasciclin-like arabinogalactan protein 1 [Brachypodium distachyon]|uniref:FAS1 domain-containing protein n=1 Tax=Brachypodium distachyon TaxID=15368 RepID=I1IR15_BRADI|nr:fasciclin-like arabinogalactan protein 1 [Brachypodium distachyon]KQJ90644.1 hypothetical protein BRADI_4g33040v3 [Brachypodium distachyon]|eukprot:XP_003576645.1 fasciclin-like arabinogalactan protein 1 [Brachypodium distachyon]
MHHSQPQLAIALLFVVVVALPLVMAAGKAAPAPAAAAPPNATAAMAKGGCKAFADLIAASPDAASTYQSAADGGVTVFCPSDAAVRAFMPRYKNLTADGKASLLLFHAVPVYYSPGSLKSNNGVMNTLATDGASKNFNFTLQNEGEAVAIKTGASPGGGVARVEATVMDRDPVAVYRLDAVVEPLELFKPVPAPAPAPAPAADAPRAGKGGAARRHPAAPAVADAPGPDADDDTAPADKKKDSKKSAAAPGAPRFRWFAAALAAVAVASVLV